MPHLASPQNKKSLALGEALLNKLHCGRCENQTRESSDKPILNAFCRVAPSVRFSVLAIRAAFVFLLASAFDVRTWSGVHVRRFVPVLAIQNSCFEEGDL
jgi:hypothetical protein